MVFYISIQILESLLSFYFDWAGIESRNKMGRIDVIYLIVNLLVLKINRIF